MRKRDREMDALVKEAALAKVREAAVREQWHQLLRFVDSPALRESQQAWMREEAQRGWPLATDRRAEILALLAREREEREFEAMKPAEKLQYLFERGRA